MITVAELNRAQIEKLLTPIKHTLFEDVEICDITFYTTN
jgi:hypothetical protein